MKDYTITISDPVTELRKPTVNDDSGVYFVVSAKKGDSGNYLIIRLLYIGRSNDVNRRINNRHHKHVAIMAECKNDNAVPLYYYAEVSPATHDDVVRAESALIYNKHPCLNETADEDFHHPASHITMERIANSRNKGVPLPKAFGELDFIVCRTAK